MTTENLERAIASTRAVIANIKPDQLDDPTPCQSWTVRDCLEHVLGGQYYFAESVNTGKAGELGGTDLARGDLVATFDDGAKAAVAAFASPGAIDKMIELPFGTMPAAAWMGIATTDTFMHGWDLAKATGQSTDLDPEFAAEVLAQSRAFIADAFRGPDTQAPFGAEQQAPAGASNADQLAAFLGRTV